MIDLRHGDCLDILRELPDNSVDAVCTDPPYGLANTDPAHVAETITRWVNGERDYLPGGAGFMGKAWDAFVPPVAVWDDCLRVLKPGGHVLAFAGSRTVDLMTLGLRLAGFDIRDSIAWLYGSGFPKSLDVSKAIDKDNGRRFEDRFALGRHIRERREALGFTRAEVNGWLGAATKCEHYESTSPGFARVPTLADFTILRERLGLSDEHLPLVERVEAERAVIGADRNWGAASTSTPNAPNGEWDITAPATDAARTWQGWGTALKPAFEPVVVARKPLSGTVAANVLAHGTGALNIDGCRVGDEERVNPAAGNKPGGASYNMSVVGMPQDAEARTAAGRWPANVVLDESQAAALDEQSVGSRAEKPAGSHNRHIASDGTGISMGKGWAGHVSTGYDDDQGGASRFFYIAKADASERVRVNGTAHPTVKPLALMRWLVRLVTPPGGVVLEPFAGSGTTVEACILEGFSCIAIEREADYLPLIQQRINRRRDPVEAVKTSGEDGGLFDLLDGGAA